MWPDFVFGPLAKIFVFFLPKILMTFFSNLKHWAPQTPIWASTHHPGSVAAAPLVRQLSLNLKRQIQTEIFSGSNHYMTFANNNGTICVQIQLLLIDRLCWLDSTHSTHTLCVSSLRTIKIDPKLELEIDLDRARAPARDSS